TPLGDPGAGRPDRAAPARPPARAARARRGERAAPVPPRGALRPPPDPRGGPSPPPPPHPRGGGARGAPARRRARARRPRRAAPGGGGHPGARPRPARHDDSMGGRALARATRSRSEQGTVALGPDREALSQAAPREPGEEDEAVVMVSGCLGLIYLTSSKERL